MMLVVSSDETHYKNLSNQQFIKCFKIVYNYSITQFTIGIADLSG